MAKLDKSTSDKGFENTLKPRKRGITRRDFFKLTAAAGAGGGVASLLDWAIVAPKVAGYSVGATGISTCPYCAVGCNVVWATGTGAASGQVVDIYGDPDCPINNGGLCSKGAASLQLVNNTRRVGVPGSIHAASTAIPAVSGDTGGGPMVRVANGSWEALTWNQALYGKTTGLYSDTPMVSAGIAQTMFDKRIAVPMSGSIVTGQAKGVAFLGSSHMTNEENWLYRKLITNFGTNNIEHQARI